MLIHLRQTAHYPAFAGLFDPLPFLVSPDGSKFEGASAIIYYPTRESMCINLPTMSGVQPDFHGHWQRLRERFTKTGLAAFADYEVGELLPVRTQGCILKI